MNKAQYKISLNRVHSLFKKYSLIKQINTSYNIAEVVSKNQDITDYPTAYQKAIDSFDYNFLLFDESFIQFSQIKNLEGFSIVKYSYYECPYEFLSYNEYLAANGFSYLDVGEDFKEDYMRDLNKAILKKHYTYIRYDYSAREYQPAIHPASHLHIGLSRSIRIPINMIITPYMFSLFVLKQCYYDRWKQLMANSSFKKAAKTSKVSCSLLNALEFSDLDKNELYLV